MTMNPSAGTKACAACGEEISSAAVKCARCGSYQNWRRYVDISNTTISLLIALISVIGLVAPVLQRISTGTQAILDEELQGIFGGSAYIFVTNSGTAPGSVQGLRLISEQVTDGMQDNRTLFTFAMQPQLIRPGDAKQLVIPIDSPVWQMLDRIFIAAKPEQRPKLYFEVDRGNLNNKNPAQEKALPVEWSALLAAGPTAWHRCLASAEGSRVEPENPISNEVIVDQASPEDLTARCGPAPDMMSSPAGGSTNPRKDDTAK